MLLTKDYSEANLCYLFAFQCFKQVLLSQVHRLRALDLLGRFLDLGPWAVSLVCYDDVKLLTRFCSTSFWIWQNWDKTRKQCWNSTNKGFFIYRQNMKNLHKINIRPCLCEYSYFCINFHIKIIFYVMIYFDVYVYVIHRPNIL